MEINTVSSLGFDQGTEQRQHSIESWTQGTRDSCMNRQDSESRPGSHLNVWAEEGPCVWCPQQQPGQGVCSGDRRNRGEGEASCWPSCIAPAADTDEWVWLWEHGQEGTCTNLHLSAVGLINTRATSSHSHGKVKAVTSTTWINTQSTPEIYLLKETISEEHKLHGNHQRQLD